MSTKGHLKVKARVASNAGERRPSWSRVQTPLGVPERRSFNLQRAEPVSHQPGRRLGERGPGRKAAPRGTSAGPWGNGCGSLGEGRARGPEAGPPS